MPGPRLISAVRIFSAYKCRTTVNLPTLPGTTLISTPAEVPVVNFKEMDGYYLMATDKVALRAYLKPLRFASTNPEQTLVWRKRKDWPMARKRYNTCNGLTMKYFYGGGMQNGRFSHRDKTILMRIDAGEDGVRPESRSFYTQYPGIWRFAKTHAPANTHWPDTVKLQHFEARFDCYYFAGESLKERCLNAYTHITRKTLSCLHAGRWEWVMPTAITAVPIPVKAPPAMPGTTPDAIPPTAEYIATISRVAGYCQMIGMVVATPNSIQWLSSFATSKDFTLGLWTNGVRKLHCVVGEYGSRLGTGRRLDWRRV